jgi:hypothetical protein
MDNEPKCKICIKQKQSENTFFNPSGCEGDWYCKAHFMREFQRLRELLIKKHKVK